MNVQRRISSFAPGPAAHAIELAVALRQLGVRRIFGVPGGRAGLDLIAAARGQGIRFVPTRHESAAVIAAGVTGELSGVPGVALVRQGPGITNALAGLASMSLDRAPTLLICDGPDPTAQGASHGQSMEPMGIVTAMLKAHVSLLNETAAGAVRELCATAMAAPRGPVLLEMTRPAQMLSMPWPRLPEAPLLETATQPWIDNISRRVARAHRPVIVLGMESRSESTAASVLRLAEALACPVFVTYKAKGVFPDDHRLNAGIFTGGMTEEPIISQCDLMVLIGLDPVEVPEGSWQYDCQVVEIALGDHLASAGASDPLGAGTLAPVIDAVGGSATMSSWAAETVPVHRAALHAALAYPGRRDSVGPQRVVEMAQAATAARGLSSRIAVDAGAHMISATTFWCCSQPNDLLISHGPAASSFAVPAAIAGALQDPSRPVMAFVDAAGLSIYLAELSTAVAASARMVVIVFNDEGPQQRGGERGGAQAAGAPPTAHHIDFAQVMRGFGGRGTSVRTVDDYVAALDAALSGEGPALIDVQIDPAGYDRQWKAMRG